MKCLMCGEKSDMEYCSTTCFLAWRKMLENGEKAWGGDNPPMVGVVKYKIGNADMDLLAKEIVAIAKTGTMPDGDHVPTHVMNWFCEWAKRIEGGKA